MEHLSNNIKVLIVVEGEKTEPTFFDHFFNSFSLKADLYTIGTNIYSLYDRMKYYEFNCDVKEVLKELSSSKTDQEILSQNFTYTYLVFDSDLQHKEVHEREKSISSETLAENNFFKLKEMADYFIDETDPSIGRLYINYPMMESFRYCDSFNDENYLNSKISINDLPHFKHMASKMKMSGIPISNYTKDNFRNLVKMNIQKLKTVSNEVFEGFPTYKTYQNISNSTSIVKIQYNIMRIFKELSVINTSLFIIVDYYGNRNEFFDKLISP